jgi:hypothetical protein
VRTARLSYVWHEPLSFIVTSFRQYSYPVKLRCTPAGRSQSVVVTAALSKVRVLCNTLCGTSRRRGVSGTNVAVEVIAKREPLFTSLGDLWTGSADRLWARENYPYFLGRYQALIDHRVQLREDSFDLFCTVNRNDDHG